MDVPRRTFEGADGQGDGAAVIQSPHYSSQGSFAKELLAFIRELPEEQKKQVRAALYKWSDERLAELKPADLGKN